jgi:GPH family glycoside/pentoside/hexuronide:cation symporter
LIFVTPFGFIHILSYAGLVEDRSAELNGVRQEGLIFATRNFSKKAISGMGIMLAGIILGLVGFPEGANPETISRDTVNNLVLVYIPILLVLYALSCFIIRFNQIDKQKHKDNLAQTS